MPRAKTRRREAEPQIETTIESTGIYEKVTQKGTNTEGMKQVMNAFAERHNHIRDTWLDRVEKDMADALTADGLCPGQREDAGLAVNHAKVIRHAMAAADIKSLAYESFQLGLVVQRFSVREWEHPAAEGKLNKVNWRGQWIKVTEIEKTIIQYMCGSKEAPVQPLYQQLYDENMTSANRNRFEAVLSRLNTKLTKDEIRIRFHIRDQVIIQDEIG